MAWSLVRRRAALRLAVVMLAPGLLNVAASREVPAAGSAAENMIDRSLAFDIPAQPLPSAMLTFSRVSNVQVLYDSRDAAQVTCNPVSGRMSSGQALRELLKGTGFIIHYAGPGAVTLVRPGEPAPAVAHLDMLQVEAASVRIGATRFTAYASEVLTDLQRAVQEQAAPGQGRRAATVKVWLAPNGRVQRAEIVKSTGDAVFDAAVRKSLAGAVVRRPPPDGLPQPLVYEFWAGAGS